jgi:hypothetical protein
VLAWNLSENLAAHLLKNIVSEVNGEESAGYCATPQLP